METIIRLVLLAVAVLGLPAGYVSVCRSMRHRGVPHAPYIRSFFSSARSVGGFSYACFGPLDSQ
jgi:hypothetical protein